jgi:Uma2 family endonuclease
MSALRKERWTVQEYLAFERASEEKHEYFDGEIFLMAGAKRNHNLVMANTLSSLHTQLRQSPCQVYPSDMRVRMTATKYVYPDISIVCEPPQFEDSELDILLNPLVVIEVLSPSTEKFDRGAKAQAYRALPSLMAYLLIAQDKPHIELYTRRDDGNWLLSEAAGLDAAIALPLISCALALAEVYEKVHFDAEN